MVESLDLILYEKQKFLLLKFSINIIKRENEGLTMVNIKRKELKFYQFGFEEIRKALNIPEDEIIKEINDDNLYGWEIITSKDISQSKENM